MMKVVKESGDDDDDDDNSIMFLRVADGGGSLQIWWVGANILNKQLRTTNKGWSSSLGVGRWAKGCLP